MLVLYRYQETTARTHGIMLLDNKFVCETLELPWRQNERNRSSIPLGLYRLRWAQTGHHWPCYEVEKVPDRDGILIHPANSVSELEGCIAVGQKFGDQLQNSAIALGRLHELVGDSMSLLVTNKFGG